MTFPSTSSLWFHVVVFAVAAGGVWLSGAKLTAYVDLIADRSRIGEAFAGALLLGGATSLPEIATTLTASSSGAAELAGTNLLGGIVMQLAVLAAVDALALRGRALTFFSPKSALLMHGVMLIFLTAMATAAVAAGELFQVAAVGFWPVLLAVLYVLALWVIYRYEGSARWMPAGEVGQPPESARDLKDARLARYRDLSMTAVSARFLAAALGVLVFGFVVARAGERIAAQSGVGQSFVGATLVALATSLPEVSTTWSAVRFGAYSMAVANILGTNSLEVALFLPADVAYREGAIFDALPRSAGFLAALGIVCTAVYLWGILERRDRTVLGMGIDSAVVLLIYGSGLVVFYLLPT